MGRVAFSDDERHIVSFFCPGAIFFHEDKKFITEYSGKPTCAKGEPKTDIYVMAREESSDRKIELKISYKKKNADFLENKTNAARASEIFGDRWESIIRNSTESIHKEFENKPLIYKEKHGRTQKGSFTLGWKFELVNKPGGYLSDQMRMTTEQLIDVYSGSNLPPDKRNANVDGRVIPNSGIADYILSHEISQSDSVQSIVDNLVTVEDYVYENPQIYFACKALNYRSFDSKYDGNRPLSVFVEWGISCGRLTPTLRYDKPLTIGGDFTVKRLIDCMRQLGIQNTDDIHSGNISSTSIVYGV